MKFEITLLALGIIIVVTLFGHYNKPDGELYENAYETQLDAQNKFDTLTESQTKLGLYFDNLKNTQNNNNSGVDNIKNSLSEKINSIQTTCQTKEDAQNAYDALNKAIKTTLPGPPGPSGSQGSQGIPGPQGTQGIQGIPGPQATTYASGGTIQTLFYGSSLGTQANTATRGRYPVSIFTFSVTPKSSNSFISVNFDAYHSINGGGNDSWATGITINGREMVSKNYYFVGGQDSSMVGRNGTNLFPLSTVYKNNDTSPVTISINMGIMNSDDEMRIYNWICQVQEVQV